MTDTHANFPNLEDCGNEMFGNNDNSENCLVDKDPSLSYDGENLNREQQFSLMRLTMDAIAN